MIMKLIHFQNEVYIIKKEMKDNNITSEELNWFKWYSNSDVVLKKNGILFFCQHAPCIEFEDL